MIEEEIEELTIEEEIKPSSIVEEAKVKSSPAIKKVKSKDRKKKVKRFTNTILVKRNKKNRLILVFGSLLVLIGIAIVFFISFYNKANEKPEYYTLIETDKEFTFDDGTGVVVSRDPINYYVELNNNKVFNSAYDLEKKDVIDVGDELFSYKVHSLDENDVKNELLKVINDGIIMSINDNLIEVIYNVEFKIMDINSYEPTVGQCVLYDNGRGEVKSITTNGSGTEVVIDTDDDYFEIVNNSNKKIYFPDTSIYACAELHMNNTKVVTPSGEEDPIHVSDSKAIVYTDSYTFNKDIEEYELLNSVIKFSKSDEVSIDDVLVEEKYAKKIVEDVIVKSEVDGVISNINKTDTLYEIIVLNKKNNVVEFVIPKEYQEKVTLNQKVLVSTSDFSGEGSIIEIRKENDENIAVVNDDSFNDLGIDAVVDISISGSEGTVILVPIDYINNGKAKKMSGESYNEVPVKFEAYNADYYLVLSGLNVHDVIEKY